jgi:hypothetical protein
MTTIHVANIEKYQPAYKDGRRLLWMRWDLDAHNRDYKISKLTPEQRWLFIGLICLEMGNQAPIQCDEKWISDSLGFTKNHIHKHLLMLQTLGLIVTDFLVTSESSCPTDIQTDNTDNTYNTVASQTTGLLASFNISLQEKIKVYIERNRLKNKSQAITEGRKQTLITELWNSKERCADDNTFGYAVDQAIQHDACCIGYVNKVWANKKAKVNIQ